MTAMLTSELQDDFLAALLAGDARHARHLAERAVDEGLTVSEVYLKLLQPALEEIGRRWEAGEIGVAWEHRATAITQGIIGSLGPRMRVLPTTGRLAVLACTPGELHAIGVQMAGDFLEAAGWEVILLGASVPAGSLVELVRDEAPDVVGLSTSTAEGVDRAGETLAALAALDPPPFIVVGGRGWNEQGSAHAAALGADVLVGDPTELTRELAGRFPPVPDDVL